MISYLGRKQPHFLHSFHSPKLLCPSSGLLGYTGKNAGDSGLNPHPVYFNSSPGFIKYLEIILGQ